MIFDRFDELDYCWNLIFSDDRFVLDSDSSNAGAFLCKSSVGTVQYLAVQCGYNLELDLEYKAYA